uniref:Si:dkey-65b12.6 n=1 Tax=Scleropages formosus TaxID=113540 RepID=A0A8C9V6I5_SCLFO
MLCQHIQKYVALCQSAGITVKSWRTETFCCKLPFHFRENFQGVFLLYFFLLEKREPVTNSFYLFAAVRCPANSHYELCADTCSSTCASLSVSSKCPKCQEGCQCDDGFVFDGDMCVPLQDCGCFVDGHYYKVCFTLRKGDPCEKVKCREKEKCHEGVCVHTSKETCTALGDPHYNTFDGKRFDFQGTCTYIIATTVNNTSGLTPFAILTKNDHRGNQRVAYVRTVTVMVYNQTIVINKERGTVNGLKTFLPVTLADGKLRVMWSGWYAVLMTDFGLEVKYDWDMKLYITAPSSYFRSLGGLCGNYNGDRQDDFTDLKGTKISTVIEFAKSWKVKDGDLFCHDDCVGECPSCSETLQEKYRSEIFCGLMAKNDGPFSSCHGTIEPNMYIDNCVYDVCINKGYKKSLCDNMESYANFCQEKGMKLDISWRTLADCPTECPENSHYEPCGTACPASCGDLDAPTKCKMACVEGCQCNTGFARSGDKCVPLKSCGCTYEGQYYPSGKEFWADSKCTQQCKCNPASAKVECSKVKCKNSQVCDLRNGVRDCYPVSFGTCQGSGDPHYRTFDGKKFDFQGTCTYYLSKLVNTADPSLVPFEVRVQNQNRGRNRAVSYTKTVEITVYGSTVVLSKENPGKVLVSMIMHKYILNKVVDGFFGVVKTDFGLMLKFNWDSHVALTLPSSYSGEIGGLCGNWNGLADDDMMTPDKSLAKTPTAFGISWKVRDDPGCSSDCNDNKCPTCQPDLMDRYQKREFCGIITDRNGPFKDCHSKVDPKQYFDDCAYDMCLYQGHATALCAALGAYTSACQEASASVDVWRSDSLCPPSCKANSHYEVCATGCPQTCSDLTESSGCEGLPCTEGCACDDGFLLSDGECVPVAECGCVHFGRSYKAGQVFFPEVLCEQRCVCQAGGRVQCNAYGCGPNEKCQVKDGVQACHPDGTGTCTVFGASQYRSFDSQSFSLSGDCMYKMVEVIRSLEEKTTFSVLVQQKSAGGDTMVTRTVEIRVYEYKLAILPRASWCIMVIYFLHFYFFKLKAYQNGFNVIVEMDFGLKVSYDGFSGVRIEIPSTYKGAVGGLCGNFNDDKADDFMLPSGVQAVSAEKFAEEWVNTQEGRTCHTGCGSQCPPTDEKKRPEAEKACSILTSKDGPVSQCHSLFPPQQHFQECVQDLITDPKNANMLCQHIQKYVALCQSAGITVKSWRTETFCSVRCPANSHYELCADTCSSTCASLSVSSKCPKCQEGCQCDDGFVFDGDVCVPLQDCGCFVDGHYYKSGQTVMWNNYPCMELTCREKEDCILKGDTGTAICVPRSKTSCWAIGDPHYQTFDGTIFGFQGTCSYTVAKTNGKDDSLTAFSIVNKNEIRGNSDGSFLKSASIKVKGHEISILNHERGKVRIDGVISNIPLSLESDSIKFRQSGIRGIMETDFGFQVTFDWSTLFMVTVTSSYYDNLAGICGTYNANQTDDFTTPSGVVVTNITEWAQSWSVPDRDPFCWHYCKGYCPTCSDEDQELYSSTKYCGLIESKEGPFSQCHNTLAPEESASNCLYDVCLNKGRQEVYCAALTNYVAACQKVGGTVSPEWRQISNCPLICPENSHYELCGSPCPATCAGPIAPETCPFPCVEGCQCNDSFVLSGEKCVSRIEGCGCPHEGHYYMPDETFWADNRCQSKCTCDSTTRIVVCKKSGCKSNEACKVVDGIRACYPVSFKTCTAQGDPHFQSFDGKRFDFQGNCVYKLAGVCSKDPNLESFDITLENNNRGNRRVSFAKVVTVKTAGNTFTISRDIPGKVLVSKFSVTPFISC